MREVNFDTSGTCVPGGRNDDFLTLKGGFGEGVVGEFRPGLAILALWIQGLKVHFRAWTLEGQQGPRIARIRHLDIPCMRRHVLLNPSPVLAPVGRIDHEHVFLVMEAVHEQIVHNAPPTIGHATVLNLSVKQPGGIVA